MRKLRSALAMTIVFCMMLSMFGTISFAEEVNGITIPDPIFELDLSEYDSKFKGTNFNTTAKNAVADTDIQVDIWNAVNGAEQDGSVIKHTLDSINGASTDYIEMKAIRPTKEIQSGWRGYQIYSFEEFWQVRRSK